MKTSCWDRLLGGVQAARIDLSGELVDCQANWITMAWQKSREER